MRRLSIVCLLLTASILLLISPVHAAGWTATVTKLDLTAGPGHTAAYLAPDGSRFAYVKADSLCLYSLAGEKGNCIALERGINMDLETVRWSPDSTKLAFSEDFLITFRDSDIWLYDTETNTLKDLTPAPPRELKFLSNTDPNVIYTVDLIPQWSADSQSIYFIRYSFSQSREAIPDFYRINIADEELEKVASPQTKSRFAVYSFALNHDDSQIAYNLDTRKNEKDGTWFLDVEANEAKFAAAATQDTAPWNYQFSPDDSLLLVVGVDIKGGIGIREPDYSPIYTIPVSGGRQQTLNTESYVFAAGWGQKDSTLAYATYDQLNPEKEGLYITGAPGKVGDLVLSGRFIAPTSRVRTPIIWAANDTLLLSQTPDYKLVVVQLKQS